MQTNRFDISALQARVQQRLILLPRAIGVVALEFFDDSFRNQGFTNNILIPWRGTRKKKNFFGARSSGILIGRGHLRRGTRMVSVTSDSVTLGNSVAYAEAHNKGVDTTVAVKAFTRRKTSNVFVYNTSTRRKKKVRTDTGTVQVKAHSRHMRLPKRQFMGASARLNEEIKKVIIREINNAIG
jgi:phage gpG-like protein